MATTQKSAAQFQAKDLTTVTYQKRNLVMYSLQKHEVDILCGGYASPGLALFGIFCGAALTLWVTYKSMSLPEPWATRFWELSSTFGGLAVICAFWAVKDWRKAKAVVDTIKSETVEYVVEEKKDHPKQGQ